MIRPREHWVAKAPLGRVSHRWVWLGYIPVGKAIAVHLGCISRSCMNRRSSLGGMREDLRISARKKRCSRTDVSLDYSRVCLECPAEVISAAGIHCV